MYFWSIGLATLLVVEEHRVANANVEGQNEHFQDVHRLHLLATATDYIEGVFLMEPMATRGTTVPLLSMSASRREKFYSKPNQFRRVVELVSIWIDICQATGQCGNSKIKCRKDDCTRLEHFPFHKALCRVGSGICTERSQFQSTTKAMPQKKERASTRQAGKGRGGEGAAITHWPRDSEPDCLQQFVATPRQKYEVHTNQEQ